MQNYDRNENNKTSKILGPYLGGDDVAHNAFGIEIENEFLIGEWEASFHAGNNNFDISIINFGYKNHTNIGSRSPYAKQKFELSQIEIIKPKITALFNEVDKKGVEPPFSLSKSNFTKEIFYQNGWIIT